MTRHHQFRLFVAVSLVAAAVWILAPGANALPRLQQATATGRTQYTGDAYGTYAFAGSVVKAGKSAVVGLGDCGTLTPPVSNSNTVATVNAAPYVTTGVINTTASATDGTTQTSQATADVHGVSVLDGLITADEVKAVSTTSRNASGFHVSAAGSNLVNLVVNGVSITVVPAPNTKIKLPGIGRVVLNEQIATLSSSSASLTVNMIHVFVTVRNSLVKKGTQIIVAHATSGLTAPVGGTLDGFAYGSSANVSNTIIAGKSAFIALGCLGTNGVINSNSVASVNVPDILTTGTVQDTAQGTVSPTTASGETTSTVQTVNVASGAVTVDLVKADAHSFTDGSTFTFGDGGSQFVNLSVSGHPEIGANVASNTQVTITGLGTLWLRREIRTANSIEIRMIELIVNVQNSLGIPVGTDIRVAVAEASAH
jgi:uncharacterized protein YdbL (DUF1318 family)